MGIMFWMAVILTSPFWMVLGIVLIHYLFAFICIIVIGFVEIVEEFFELFK